MTRGRKKILIAIGTRPEAIKMAPVIWELKKIKRFDVKVVAVAQHRQMLDLILKVFKIIPDYDLNIMQAEQTLSDISINIFKKINKIYYLENPDLVLVQGDTLTSFIVCLAAFYVRIPTAHVEAGLRTNKKYYPFPEEVDRQLIDIVVDFYLAPTPLARGNLLKEGKDRKRIFVTGNTVVDALLKISKMNYPFANRNLAQINYKKYKVILVETHRREIWGDKMHKIHAALRKLVDKNEDIFLVFPVHLNPIVQQSAKLYLSGHERILLISAIDYKDLVKLIKNVYFIITDSGGLQEEAPTFGKPVLVVREETERVEGIKAGIAKLIGLDSETLLKEAEILIKSPEAYRAMARAKNPYGDGHAAARIAKILSNNL